MAGNPLPRRVAYEAMLRLMDEQRCRCAICGRLLTQGEAKVDHCHTTGRIRGVLCNACNVALGLLKDSPALLRRAAQYLAREKASA